MISILLPHLRIGGTERVNLDLAYEFARKGHCVEFVLMQADGELLDEAQKRFSVVNLKCYRIRNLPKKLIRYFRKKKPDNIIASLWPLTVIAPCIRFFSNHGCKIIICEHNNLSLQYRNKGMIHSFIMKLSMHVAYRLADSRVGVSNGVVNNIAKLSGLPHKMFEVIYNPIPSQIEPSKKAINSANSLWSCDSGARILTVGNLVSQKNYELLLRAFARINIPNSRLMFVGDGIVKNSLKLLAQKLSIDNRVIFAGYQSDTTPFYKTADLFVLSSDYEGMSLVIVEALSSGTPVVSTNCPSGPAELLENGRFGQLVPVGDEKSLAKAIIIALDSKVDKLSLIKRSEDFLPEIVASKYLKLIKEMA